MVQELSGAILHTLARNVDCRSTLAVLCQVSTSFRDIFTPVLYERIELDHCDFRSMENMSRLPLESHLSHVKRLRIGGSVYTHPGDSYQPVLEAMARLIQKSINLKAFTIEGRFIRDFADEQDGAENSVASSHVVEDDEDDTQTLSPLQLLFKLKQLEEVSLISSPDDIMEFNWSIPHFRNLRKLALHRLERESWPGNVEDIAEILFSSPGLTSLRLSLRPETGLVNDSLRVLINHYHSKRGTQPLLKLSHLHLGLGFLPVKPRQSFPKDNYLSQLTDLQALTELKLDNCRLNPEHFDISDFEIHTNIFSEATHLQKISVERLGSDIIELINLITLSSKRKTLDELEVSRYFETLDTGEEIFKDECGYETFYSVPLEQSGFHWRKLSYGTHLQDIPSDAAIDLLRNYISHCPDIEELSLPMTREHIEFFKSYLMPRTKKLRILTIPRGLIADKRGYEVLRLGIVKDFFETNRRMMQQDSEITPLRHIGIGRYSYCCLLCAPYSDGFEETFLVENEKFQIIRLDHNQSGKF